MTARRFTPKIVGGIDHLPDDRSQKQSTDAQVARRPPAESLSITAQNECLREQRREVWRAAEAATHYWRARLDLHGAISWAQRMETPEGRAHPAVNDEDRYPLVEKWHAAFAKQLLTPAWDAASVAWKQNALTRGRYEYTGLKPDRLKHAISEDLAFLAAHPARQRHNSSEAIARRREFKEAMRRRIREIAASRDLSDEEIKPALTLKHHEIGRFSQQHGVNIGWLLEGTGRIFKKDPITLNPNMTGSEFAAVVTTLPMADQQVITTMVREILNEKLDHPA